MKYYLLEIVTASGLAFIYGENGSFIYNDPIEAQQDARDNGEEGIVEVFSAIKRGNKDRFLRLEVHTEDFGS